MNAAAQIETEIDQHIIIVDGYHIDADTGEVLAHAVDEREHFLVNDRASAEWVLNKMLQVEAEIAAISQTEAVIHARAILANAEAMKKPLAKRLEWLHRRFDEELGEFARGDLMGKGRTWKSIFGSISLRIVGAKVKLRDEATALRITECDPPQYAHAVKTVKSFLISNLTAEEVAEIQKGLAGNDWGPDDMFRTAFELVPERETVTIKTGVG